MRIIVVSGLSGSGKSVVLHLLEDLGFYCIDNLPAPLLEPFISHTVRSGEEAYRSTAIGLDARNTPADIAMVPRLVEDLGRSGIDCEVIFLLAGVEELLRRYAETRRRHPLSGAGRSLRDAIEAERGLLEPIAYAADLVLDTSRMSVHELRDQVQQRVERRAPGRLSLQFESFGFKHGIPGDADFVFDARALPNPYWEPALRTLSGRDPEVRRFLESHTGVARLIDDIEAFVAARLAESQAANRRFMTVAIGCTGGQHRSVYVADRLAERFAARHPQVTVRHTSLSDTRPIERPAPRL